MTFSQNKKISFVIFAGVIYIGALFFFCRFAYPYPNFPSSPDEKAALTYANEIAHGGTFFTQLPHDIPSTLKPYFIPRSTAYNSSTQSIQYGSYLGLPTVYGLLFKIVPIQFVFALIGLLGSILVYYLFRLLQASSTVCFFGSALFALNPFVMYYTVRGGMHQMLFIDFLLASIVFLLHAFNKKKIVWFVISGILLGFAAATRTNEMIWAVPLLGLVYLWKGTKQNFLQNAFSLICGAIVSFAPFVGISKLLSGSLTQYRTINTEAVANAGSSVSFVKSLIFPFGFNSNLAFYKFWAFSKNIWWVFALLAAGFLFLFVQHIKQKKWKQLVLTLCLLGLGIYTILFYGPFAQELPRNVIWVSHSHYRYWLPLFASAGIVFALAINTLEQERYKKIILFIITPLFAIGSFLYIMFGSGGLTETRYRNILDYQKNQKLHHVMPANALVLAGKADKFIYPDWFVVSTTMYDNPTHFIEVLKTTPVDRPLYYYYAPLDGDSKKVFSLMQSSGIQMKYVTILFEGETLYQLVIPHS